MLLENFIYGIILGIGFIIPGVSGGVLATIIGIYDKIISILNNPFKNVKFTLRYMIPLILGIVISIISFSKLILHMLNNHNYFISYTFIGLILGTIPYLFQEIKNKTSKNILILPFIISFLFGLILYFIENNTHIINSDITIIKMVIAGIIYAIGKIVPGISGASLLMFLGIYEYLLEIVANPSNITLNIIISLIPFFISLIISLIIIIKIINYLLKYHYLLTYSFILGFVFSSILFIYPHFISLKYLIISLISFIISANLSKIKK